jgi:peptidoglycan/xylan/chitin deacetylase (PgdA/CDA1 family)
VGELHRALGNRTRRAAFLTYHAISDTGPAFLHVPPDMYERQLALLRRKGWAPGTTAGLDALAAGERPAAPLAFLTFDDGYVDNHRDALPLLREYGFRAIVFVLPPMVDGAAPLRWPEVEDAVREHPGVMRSMSWEQVGEMVEAGTEIGAHTMTHPKLSTLHGEELREELVDSREVLEEVLGHVEARVIATLETGDHTARLLDPVEAELPDRGATPLTSFEVLGRGLDLRTGPAGGWTGYQPD